MFDYEIKKNLIECHKFVGVFPRDKIPSITSYPSSIIVNTDDSSKPGTHWVAMRFTERECEYFDSFGMPPLHSEMIRAVAKRRLVWNGRCIQHPRSRSCGEFCIAFVKMRSQRVCFASFIKIFHRNTKDNDIIAKRICCMARLQSETSNEHGSISPSNKYCFEVCFTFPN